MSYFNEGQGPMYLESDLECSGFGLTDTGYISFQPGGVSLTSGEGNLYVNGVKISTAGDTEVISTNGSGIVVNTSGDIVTLSSGFAAGPGIQLTPSSTTKILTISAPTPSLSQVLTSGSSGISMTLQSINVANNSLGSIVSDNLITSPNYKFTTLQLSQPTPTRIKTNTNETVAYLSDIQSGSVQTITNTDGNIVLAGTSNITANLNSTLTVSTITTGRATVNDTIVIGGPSQNTNTDVLEVFDGTALAFFHCDQFGNVGRTNINGSIWNFDESGNLITNGSIVAGNPTQQTTTNNLEVWDSNSGHLYFNKAGQLGYWSSLGYANWLVNADASAIFGALTANTSATVEGSLSARYFTIPAQSGASGDLMELFNAGGDHYLYYNTTGTVGSYPSPGNAGGWNIDKVGNATTNSLTTNSITSSGNITITGDNNLTAGNAYIQQNIQTGTIVLNGAVIPNRVRAITPGGTQELAYVSDVNALTLNDITAVGNDCNGAAGIILDAGSGSSILVAAPGPNQFTVGSTSPGADFTATFDSGTIVADSMNFQADNVTLTSAVSGGKRLFVQGGAVQETVAFLSDIPTTLQTICGQNNIVSGNTGIVYAPSLGGTPSQGVLVTGEANYELQLSNNDQTGNIITLNVGGGVGADGAGTVQCSTVALPTGTPNDYMNVSKVAGQNRIQVAQTGYSTQEIAYLSDIASSPVSPLLNAIYKASFGSIPLGLSIGASAALQLATPSSSLQQRLSTTGLGGMIVFDLTEFSFITDGVPASNSYFVIGWQSATNIVETIHIPSIPSNPTQVVINLGMVHIPMTGTNVTGGPWSLYITNNTGTMVYLQTEGFNNSAPQFYITSIGTVYL